MYSRIFLFLVLAVNTVRLRVISNINNLGIIIDYFNI